MCYSRENTPPVWVGHIFPTTACQRRARGGALQCRAMRCGAARFYGSLVLRIRSGYPKLDASFDWRAAVPFVEGGGRTLYSDTPSSASQRPDDLDGGVTQQ